jgi:hypothetical protein
MKKLYLLLTAVTALITTTTMAQCPNPNGFAYPFKYSGECYVFVTNTLPNADINVFNGTTRINTTEAQTDANGQGSVFFNCAQTITRVIMTTNTSTTCEISGNNIAVLTVLPIKLSDFKAQVKGNSTAAIQWTSEFEVGSEKYVVERSLDGVTYTAIGEVAAAKNSMEKRRYNFDDAELGDRAAYYRLQMVDLDGKKDLSRTIYVNNKRSTTAPGTFNVFPNPFKSDVQLVGVNASDVNRKSIRVYNVAGKEIGYTVTGANAITIDASAPRGVYILRVQEKTFKLVKE